MAYSIDRRTVCSHDTIVFLAGMSLVMTAPLALFALKLLIESNKDSKDVRQPLKTRAAKIAGTTVGVCGIIPFGLALAVFLLAAYSTPKDCYKTLPAGARTALGPGRI
jgi:hypothetical protein